MKKDAIHTIEREVRTFADLAHGANVLFDKASEDEKGSYYTTMSSLILTAFTFEAFLNHLGNDKIKFWNDIEKIKVMEKLSVICKEINYEPDFSRRPYQTIKFLFKFRNAIAHGKSMILKESKEIDSSSEYYSFRPRTETEEYCNLKNAQRANEDIRKIIEELHAKAGLKGYPFKLGGASGSISLKQPNKTLQPDR